MRRFSPAALYVCSVIGAGFATGRELFDYFIRFGIWGFIGILIASFILGLTCYKVMIKGYKCTQDIFPDRLGTFFYVITALFLIVIFSAMLSAAAELFKSTLNVNGIWGSLVVTFFVLLVANSNSVFLEKINIFVFISIILICIVMCVYIVCNSEAQINYKPFTLQFLPYAIIYSAYNVITAISALMLCKHNKNIVLNSVLSGTTIFLIAILISIPLFLNYDVVKSTALPLLALIKNHKSLYFIYIIMLSSAIFTTAATCLISIQKQTNMNTMLLALSGLLLSLVGFENIIAHVYFVFGIVGIFIIYFVLK